MKITFTDLDRYTISANSDLILKKRIRDGEYEVEYEFFSTESLADIVQLIADRMMSERQPNEVPKKTTRKKRRTK